MLVTVAPCVKNEDKEKALVDVDFPNTIHNGNRVTLEIGRVALLCDKGAFTAPQHLSSERVCLIPLSTLFTKMPPQRTATPILTLIPESIPRIFEQAQITTANHQKNFVALNKLHSAAITASEPTRNEISDQSSGEKAFEDVFIEMITRLLPLKKGASVVDRVVKFIAGYIKFLHEKGE